MSEVGKKLKTVLEGYAQFLRDRDLARAQAPITPGSTGAGVPAIRGGAWQLHVRADTRPVPGRNRQKADGVCSKWLRVRPLFLIYFRLGDAFRGNADVNCGNAYDNFSRSGLR